MEEQRKLLSNKEEDQNQVEHRRLAIDHQVSAVGFPEQGFDLIFLVIPNNFYLPCRSRNFLSGIHHHPRHSRHVLSGIYVVQIFQMDTRHRPRI